MRHVLIAAAALAVGGFAVAANAQSALPYVAGGPVQVGNMCIVNADPEANDSFGYYAPCAQQAQASAPRRSRR